jgi:hypothetical protein
VLERHQDYIWCYWGATKYVDPHGVGDSVQNRAIAGADRGLADATRPHGRFGVGDIEGFGMDDWGISRMLSGLL